MKLPEGTVAIRPVRLVDGDLRYYTAISFQGDANAGCDLAFRQAFFRLGSYGVIDFLDEEGNILDDIPVEKWSFRKFLKKHKCKVETV